MTNVTHWKGTEQQFNRLVAAIIRHCTCEANSVMCPPHKMLTDQQLMDRLAWTDRTFTPFKDQEFSQ